MNSMTGFGRGRVSTPSGTLDFTLSCINKRGLEISIALPRELAYLEGELFELLRKSFERGKMQLTGRFEAASAKTSPLKKRFEELKKNCKQLRVDFEPTAALVAQLMQGGGNVAGGLPATIPALATDAVAKAIAACKKSQAAEGKRLQTDIATRLATLKELLATATKLSAATLPAQRERLAKNLKDAGLDLKVDDERVLKELALFADRVDVAEEITRIGSHLTAAGKLIVSEGAIGRPLEFLLQELLREWNTLGNKSPQLPLIQTALAAKNEIERLREQAANIS